MFFKFWILPNIVQFSHINLNRLKEKQRLVTLNFHEQVFSVSQIGRWLANISRSLNLPDQWDYVCWHVNKNKNRNKKFSSKNENVFCRITKHSTNCFQNPVWLAIWNLKWAEEHFSVGDGPMAQSSTVVTKISNFLEMKKMWKIEMMSVCNVSTYS